MCWLGLTAGHLPSVSLLNLKRGIPQLPRACAVSCPPPSTRRQAVDPRMRRDGALFSCAGVTHISSSPWSSHRSSSLPDPPGLRPKGDFFFVSQNLEQAPRGPRRGCEGHTNWSSLESDQRCAEVSAIIHVFCCLSLSVFSKFLIFGPLYHKVLPPWHAFI